MYLCTHSVSPSQDIFDRGSHFYHTYVSKDQVYTWYGYTHILATRKRQYLHFYDYYIKYTFDEEVVGPVPRQLLASN